MTAKELVFVSDGLDLAKIQGLVFLRRSGGHTATSATAHGQAQHSGCAVFAGSRLGI